MPTSPTTVEPRRRGPVEILVPPSFDDGSMAIVPWPDGERACFDPRSTYAERFWTPVLGPSTLLLHRHLVDRVDVDPEGFLLDLNEAALRLGLGERPTRNGPLGRALIRMVRFRHAETRADGVLAVRTMLPPISVRALGRLPRSLQAEHAVAAQLHGFG